MIQLNLCTKAGQGLVVAALPSPHLCFRRVLEFNNQDKPPQNKSNLFIHTCFPQPAHLEKGVLLQMCGQLLT